MPGFVKPTRKVINIEDAFGELIGKKLIKDLHDNEEICPVCHGIDHEIPIFTQDREYIERLI